MLEFSELEAILNGRSFSDFVDTVDFKKYYTENIRPKKGGGRDRISPRAYQPAFEKDIERIKRLCQYGEYQFSPYNEKLILKGRNKYPRVISVPTVRDRFVLSLINSYLRTKFNIHRRTANSYIKEAREFIESNHGLYFFKTDIKSFFDSIVHDVLSTKLKGSIDDACHQLIIKAIKTPTCESGYHSDKPNAIGVPQGISIASVLSEKYMETFDQRVRTLVNNHKGLYIRYVDDILILAPEDIEWTSIFEQIITDDNLQLTLTPEKTKSGSLERETVDYIGYTLSYRRIGIKRSNQRIFSDRLAGRCHKFIKQLNNVSLRPRFLTTYDSFLEYSIMDINLLISGFKAGAHNYGWLPYFQQLTDLKILYELDNVVRRICGQTDIADRLYSFVKTYHALRHRSGVPYVYDFDKAQTIIEKTTILLKMGRISQTDNLSDAAIEYRFNELIEDLTRDTQKDMRQTY